jgi:hypothetical protein
MTATQNRPSTPRFPLAFCLIAFCSPSLYFLLLIFINKFQFPAPPVALVASLFFLIPIVALVVCGRALWQWTAPFSRKISWMLFGFFAMTIQFGILLLIVTVAITTAISYAQ